MPGSQPNKVGRPARIALAVGSRGLADLPLLVRTIVDEVYAHGREFDAQQSNRLARLRNLAPEAAQLLAVMVRAAGARRILEVGTSNGYSTLWLADAAKVTGGHVESLDIDPRRSDQACANIARAGLDGLATCRTVSAALCGIFQSGDSSTQGL